MGSIPEQQFWDLSQSIRFGIYPRATVLGSIQEHQFRDLSQSNSSGIYPRASFSWDRSWSVKNLSLGSDPRDLFFLFWDQIPEPHFLTAGIDPRVQKRLIIFTCPRMSKSCPWDLIPETSFSFSGIRSQNPIFNRWDRSQSAKKSDYFHMLIQSKNHASNKGKMAGRSQFNTHPTGIGLIQTMTSKTYLTPEISWQDCFETTPWT